MSYKVKYMVKHITGRETENLMEQNRKPMLLLLSAFLSSSFLLRFGSWLCRFILKEVLVSVLFSFFYFLSLAVL